MKLIVFLFFIIFLNPRFIYANDNEISWYFDKYSIETEEDKKLEKELIKKYLSLEEDKYQGISPSIFCKNPTSKINTLDCIIVNIFTILVENNLKFEYLDIECGCNTTSREDTIEMLIDSGKIKYESFYIKDIVIRTNVHSTLKYLLSQETLLK